MGWPAGYGREGRRFKKKSICNPLKKLSKLCIGRGACTDYFLYSLVSITIHSDCWAIPGCREVDFVRNTYNFHTFYAKRTQLTVEGGSWDLQCLFPLSFITRVSGSGEANINGRRTMTDANHKLYECE